MACTTLSRPRSVPFVGLVPLAALALLAACGDDPVAPAHPPAQPPALPNVQRLDVSDAERTALRRLTRAVAMAMDNQGVRQQVKNDMRASRVTREHKLHFASYLKGQGGGVLLAQMAQATGLSRDTLQALVAAVRPLEFYLPVDAQRESWRGGPELIVASAFDDHDVPVGFDVRGSELALDVATPPSAPVVALVPVEADFAAPLDEASLKGRKVRNLNDRGGEAIGTYAIEGATESSAGTSSYYAGVDDGIYMTRNALNDDGESWVKGDPELEVHLHGPRNTAQPQYGEDLSCSGEHVNDYRKFFNQDGETFSRAVGSGAPLLADRYDFNQAQAKFPNGGRFFIIWEDDDTSCVIKTDRDMKKVFLQAAGVAGIASVAAILKGGAWKGPVITAVVTFAITLFTNADFLKTNDDLVGVMVPREDAPNFAGYPGTHVILNGDVYNGNADLYANWPTAENGRSYMTNLATSVTTIETNVGGAQQLSATVYDQYGAVRGGHPVGWRTTSSYVASVSESGQLSMPNPGTATIYARACDPECIDRAIQVRVTGPELNGPGYLSDGEVGTVYGYVINPRQGSYWWEWTTQTCTNGGDCWGAWNPAGSGWNSPGQISVQMWTYDAWTKVNLAIYTAPGGALVGQRELHISGPNVWPGCEGTSEIDCQPYLTATPKAGAKPAAKPGAKASTKLPAHPLPAPEGPARRR